MDQEKLLLVDRLCRNKRELARMEEKIEFFEEHTSQLTEDIQRKSKSVLAIHWPVDCVGSGQGLDCVGSGLYRVWTV